MSRLGAAAQRCLCGAEVPSLDNIHVDFDRGLLRSNSTLLGWSQGWLFMYNYLAVAGEMDRGKQGFQGGRLCRIFSSRVKRPPLCRGGKNPVGAGTSPFVLSNLPMA